MQVLQALSKGYLIQSDMPVFGKVHSVFKHVVNLSFNQKWISLLGEQFTNMPSGIRVSNIIADWRNHIDVDDTARLQDNVLRGRFFSIPLQNVSVWNIPQKSYQINTSLQVILLILFEFCAQKNIMLPIRHKINELHLTRYFLSITEPYSSLCKAIQNLIGFGKGLTPDGDDFLLGYLASFLLSHPQEKSHQIHINRVKLGIKQHLSQTNTISQHYLLLALEGHFSEVIHHLMDQLQSNIQQEEQALYALLNYGSSSGAYCLLGLLHGLDNQAIKI